MSENRGVQGQTHASTRSLPPSLSRSRPVSRFVQRTWLFDLDDTLHNASEHIFPQIHRLMTAYICQHLHLDEAEATHLRQGYWQRYGATLLGMMRHHHTDPRHFLRHTHQFDDLESMVIVERGLKSMLLKLPGSKIIFSNAPLKYTEAILAIADIRRCFDDIYSVERLLFQPKPAIGGFLELLNKERLDPRACIMVEDTLPNLKTAKRLGMKTVWVSTCTRQPPYVDVKVTSVLDLPRRLDQL